MTGTFWGSQLKFPSGIIIPWAKTAVDSPPGWVFCDGNNGTPDLRNKYCKCVPDGSTDPGINGGQNSLTLSTSQLPSHSHYVSSSSVGDHNHGLYNGSIDADNTYGSNMWNGGSHNFNFQQAGGHSHSISTDNSGSSSTIDNEPAHQTMTYIMKL